MKNDAECETDSMGLGEPAAAAGLSQKLLLWHEPGRPDKTRVRSCGVAPVPALRRAGRCCILAERFGGGSKTIGSISKLEIVDIDDQTGRMMTEMKYTTKEIADYVVGWLTAGQAEHTLADAHNAVANAHFQIDDEEDGFAAATRRRKVGD